MGSAVDTEIPKSVGTVSVTYEDVGIDGPALSELVVISVVEISVRVNVD
jgi:hypothetical protein